MTASSTSWVGSKFGDYVIQSLIAEGAFSMVFKAQHLDRDQFRVCKIARSTVAPAADKTASSASAIWTGFVQTIAPDPAEILSLQADFLKQHKGSGLIELLAVFATPEYYCLQLPYYELPSLNKIQSGKVPITFLVQLAQNLHEASQKHSNFRHGDIKPANILVGEQPILIDPGYFGPLTKSKTMVPHAVITTPIYYPKLEADDLLAFALLLWEIATDTHPLQYTPTTAPIIGAELERWIQQYESIGNYNLSPLRHLQRPSRQCGLLSPQVEALLLKGLGLAIEPSGKINRAHGFASFMEIADALTHLLASGLSTL